MAETLLIMTLFASALVFATVQAALLAVTSLVAVDSAFSAARSAAVLKSASYSGTYVFAASLNIRDSIPAGNPVKETTTEGGVKVSRAGGGIKTVIAAQKYIQRIMFSSFIMPFFGGGAGFYRGTKVCPAVISPDPQFYSRAFPGAAKW